MRSVLLAVACTLVLGLSAYLAGRPSDDPVKVRIRLVDGDSDVAGIVRVFEKGKDDPLPLKGLFERLRGLQPAKDARGWYVVPAKGAEVTLPRSRVRVEAVSGLETGLVSKEFDLSDKGV